MSTTLTSGTKTKLVVNMVIGSMMTSLAEGLRLAGAARLYQEEVIVLGLGAMANPMFTLKGQRSSKATTF